MNKKEISFQKMTKSISIYKGKQLVGYIDLKEFMNFINDNKLDCKQFKQID